MKSHLNEREVRLYQERTLSAGELLRVSDHLSECEICRNRIAKPRQTQAMANNIRASLELGESAGHLTYQELSDYVDGALNSLAMETAKAHLRGCEECWEEVSGMEALKVEIGSVRAPVIAITAGRRPAPRKLYWIAAAILLMCSGGSVWRYIALRNGPELLLARAYSESRPFEFRLPDDGYGPIRQQRAGESSALDRSPSLLRAETTIQQNLRSGGEHSSLYLLRGRAELLERQYDAAIESLTRAQELDSQSPGALSDLGCAYALRGDAEHRSLDYGHAIELLRQSMKAKPQQPMVLFNLALVYERAALVDEAAETWKRFLAMDGTSGWAKEAAQHLTKLEEQKKKRERARRQMTADPEAFLALVKAEPDEVNAELFQDAAWRDWLPRINTKAEAGEAFRTLAAMFVTRHGDSSLQDAVRAATANKDDAPLHELAAAMERNAAGKYDASYSLANHAAQVLMRSGNRAASLRARIEMAFSRQRRSAGECFAVATPLVKDTDGISYIWLHSQALLEESDCHNIAGDLELGYEDSLKAAQLLKSAGLVILQLRAQGYIGSIFSESGNFAGAWEIANRGLRECWEVAAPPARAQQFDFDLAEAAEGLEWRESAAVFGKASVRELALTGVKSIEAGSRVYSARWLRAAGYAAEADQEIAKAEAIFHNEPSSPTNENLVLGARLTRVEMTEPTVPWVREELKELEPNFLDATHATWEERIRLKQTFGMSLTASGDDPGATAKFQEGIQVYRDALRATQDPLARLATTEVVAPLYKGLLRLQLQKKHDPAGALAEWDSYRSSSLIKPAPPALPLTPDTARLVYVSLPEGLAAFTQNSHARTGRMLGVSQQEMQDVERRFLRACARPGSDLTLLKSDARQLYRWLIEPFLPELEGAHTLAIDADGWVASVPFPALIDSGGRYLIEDFTIAMDAPKIRSRPSETQPITRSDKALIVAVSSPGGGITPLAFSNEEASHVAKELAGARLLLGTSASIESIRAAAPGARLFHFAGHGWSNGGDGGLILSSPGDPPVPAYLTAAALAKFDWSSCYLAVLSACMTGSGEARGPTNPRSLVRAFLASGASRVVAARWNLDEAASSVSMGKFYASLMDSGVPAHSLALAQREVLHHFEYQHPYYWAAYAIFGEL